MSFGVLHVAPLLPEFLAKYPEVSIDLHLSDETVDVIGDGFDAAIRIAHCPTPRWSRGGSAGCRRYLVGAAGISEEAWKAQASAAPRRASLYRLRHATTPDTWRFTHKAGKSATVRPSGPLRVNNGDAMMPALIAGIGLGVLPEFIVRDALADGRLERLLPDWSLPSGAVTG